MDNFGQEDILTVKRPVLVNGTNILEAKDFELQSIIRKAQKQIEETADMAKLSKKVAAQNDDLQEIIKLCVEQLDKDMD